MGNQTFVYGWIDALSRENEDFNREALLAFPYDDVYPFKNIFWMDSPAQYRGPIIFFGGSYKGLEEHWNEWLWKFTQLLSTLEAYEARVHLKTEIIGEFAYTLRPELYLDCRQDTSGKLAVGDQWFIVESPPTEEDFRLWPSFAVPGVPIVECRSLYTFYPTED